VCPIDFGKPGVLPDVIAGKRNQCRQWRMFVVLKNLPIEAIGRTNVFVDAAAEAIRVCGRGDAAREIVARKRASGRGCGKVLE